MNTSKFLEEIEVLEHKLRQKADDENGKLSFPTLVKQLFDSKQIDEKIIADLKKLWGFRNKIYSSPTPEETISGEAQNLLDKVISNHSLK